jgi:hypothetical protein
MSTQGGFGVLLKIGGATIVSVTNVDFPAFRKFIAESTGHDSSGGYYQSVATGKRRLEPFSAEINWDAAAVTHIAVLAAFNAEAPVAMVISDPDSVEDIAFSAHVEAISRVSQQEDRYYATVEFHPTGAPTIT